MADNKDLAEIAKSATEDFYELLGVTFDSDEATIKRQYRKTSIRYHPDKNPDDAAAADRFIGLGIARDILLDTQLKSTYDAARTRRREKALQDGLLDSKRRKMKEDLERREREGASGFGLKRKRGEMSDAERREMEIQRLAEDGKRRRKEAQERLERQHAEEEASFLSSPHPAATSTEQKASTAEKIPEIDRTVRIRFPVTPETESWDKSTLQQRFSKYGTIDSVVLAKPKKGPRVSGEKHRRVTTTTFLIFNRLHAAYNCVSDAASDYPVLESVAWAGKEPEVPGAVKSPTFAESQPAVGSSAPSTPFKGSFNPRGSFGSAFGTPGLGTPSTPSFSFSPKPKAPQGAHSEEVTMMRLKAAEKRKLEEKIRREEEEETRAEENN